MHLLNLFYYNTEKAQIQAVIYWSLMVRFLKFFTFSVSENHFNFSVYKSKSVRYTFLMA